MRFSVDAHAIGRHLTGNEVYVRSLLTGFATLDQTSEFSAYVSSDDAARWIPSRFLAPRVPRNPFLRLGVSLSRHLRSFRPDLVHVQYTAPLFCPAPVVVSVHDVSYLEHPEFFPAARLWQLRVTVAQTVKRAERILTPSEFSRRRIAEAYPVDPDKIVVIPNGVSDTFRPLPRETGTARVRERFGIPAPYVLTVGDLQPRKNQCGLIDAFEELALAHPQLPHHLVLVGKASFHGAEVRARAERSAVAHRIHFTGFVGDDDLLSLYAGCDLFAFPSLYEGFGIPILEAMACGRAVACSNTSAMPEVADAAAILFDPCSKSEMVRAMRDILRNDELRGRLERLGVQRAGQFRWETTARRTLDVYYEIAEGRGVETRPVAVPVSRT